MRTARSSSRPGGLHWAPPQDATPQEQTPPGPGPSPVWTESQTPVKTLPCPNFVAGGNKEDRREYGNWYKFFIWLANLQKWMRKSTIAEKRTFLSSPN